MYLTPFSSSVAASSSCRAVGPPQRRENVPDPFFRVDSDTYLLTCYRYIELNPVCAGMVQRPADYPWSSYRRNALGRHDPGITPHAHYLALDTEPDLRLLAYQALFKDALDQADADALRAHTRQNKAFGNQRFRSRIEALVGRSVEFRPRGRPASAPGKCT